MYKKINILYLLVVAISIEGHICAQVVNVVDHVVRTKIGENFNDRWMIMAAKDSKEINQDASLAGNKEEAEKVIKEYISDEMKYVEHSWKFNDTKPRNIFRSQTANSLERLKTKYGVVPERNFIERFLIWIDGISS